MLTGVRALDNFLINHSLAKSEQKVSEVLKELNASQTREQAVSEAGKVDKATFEEATKRLESRVSSLEVELDRSRETYVVWSTLGFGALTPSQRQPSEPTVAGMKLERHYVESESTRVT